MSAHTPGPWQFRRGGILGNWPEVVVSPKDREPLVRLYGPNADDNGRFIVQAANSHAAMLDALRQVLREMPWGGLEQGHLADVLANAIAKAEGRAA